MDAISFVLGIKSSHLRSAHLKDLVYRGRVLKTAKINDDGSVNPDGQLNGASDRNSKGEKGDPRTAWVMAVYVDDADDVHKWKRSITSSGVSEYRINDRVVTAQQYNEALEAENILIKARNFLVFQGDVEAIASQSPQDLTHLIEQISGSLEFKPEYERLQALQEQAAENLTFQLHRRRGINTEIKQYREQKKEAENFQNKLNEKDAAIVAQTLWKLYHFQSAMNEATESIDVHQEDLKNLRRNVETYEHKLESTRKEHQAVNRQATQVSRDIKSKEKSIEDKENSIVPYDEKLKETEKQLETLNNQAARVEKEREERVEAVNKVAHDLKIIEKAEQVFEARTEEQMKKQGRAISAADRREYDSLQAQVEARAATNQSGLQHLERSHRAEDVTVKNLKGKVDRLTATIQRQEAELYAINEKRDSAQETSADLTKSIAAKKKEYTQRQSQRVQANQKRTDLEEKLQDVLTKLREVDDGRRQNAKEARIKDTVASLKSIFSGVRGRVGDLCKPKQKKFEEAVLVALGSDFDSIVVDTEKTASDCIAYLKEQRIPSMRFIPLDNIKVHAVNTAVKGINGVRLTIDTINFESSVERAISYACGNSVVCDTLDIAKHICYEKKISVEAVTLDGFVIHESGTMTGGRGPESSKNKRKFEDGDVQNLQRMVDKLRNEIESLPRAERAGDDEEALQTELTGLERRLALLQDELSALKRNHASKKRETDSLRRELREQQPKYEAKAAALEELSTRVQEYKEEISRVEDEVFADFCSRLGYADVRAYRTFQGQFDQEVQQKRNDYATQKQQLRSRLSWEQDRHKATEQRLEKTTNSIRKLKRDIKQYIAEKAEVEEELQREQAELEVLTDRLEEYTTDLADKAEKVAAARAELQKRSKDIDSKQKEVDRLEVTVKTNSANKSALLRRCRLEQIQIPLLKGTLDDLPNEDNLLGGQDADAMELDEEDEVMMNVALDDHGIDIDYSDLDDAYKEVCESFRFGITFLTIVSRTALKSRANSLRT